MKKERFLLTKIVMAIVIGVLIGIAVCDMVSVSHEKRRAHHEAVISESNK